MWYWEGGSQAAYHGSSCVVQHCAASSSVPHPLVGPSTIVSLGRECPALQIVSGVRDSGCPAQELLCGNYYLSSQRRKYWKGHCTCYLGSALLGFITYSSW